MTCEHDWHIPLTNYGESGHVKVWHITMGWGMAMSIGPPNTDRPLHSHGYYRCRKCEKWTSPCSIGHHRISEDPEGKLGFEGKVCWDCTPPIYFSSISDQIPRLTEAKKVFDPDYATCTIRY